MEVACPVLPSQHRLPLQESTGNAQSHASSNSNNALAYCSPVTTAAHSSPASSTSLPSSTLPLVSCTPVTASTASSVPTAPILPTQSLDASQLHGNYTYHSQHTQPTYYSEALIKPLPSQQYTPHPTHKYQQQQQLLSRRQSLRHGSLALGGGFPGSSLISSSHGLGPGNPAANANVNPIYLSPQFQAYRKKQTEKDDKTEQIWPDVLEDAFLDALLLIPQMGRKKYAMRGQLHGRNMLISEYLWVAYCLSLPPGVKPDRKMARGRKQVSSHIQVLKNFFIHHRCYHFFFPSKEKKEDTRKDLLEKESFKDNLVLRALFDGRLPEERPNYEYFGQLLASDALVALRPSLCWILVSSAAVRYESEGPRRGEACKPDGLPLDGRVYPHLHLNNKREEWPERGKIIRGTLLQEYTRALSQKEASSVREISQDWEDRFPGQMCEALDQVVREDLRDILHFHVTLDVQEPDRFPEGSELNSLVEVTIEQPYLQNHRWKSVTRLARPHELVPGRAEDDEANSSTDQVPVSVITREIGNQYMHRPGCHGVGNGGHCDCFQSARMRRQQLAVPFPAPEWATMLSMLTGYRKHPLEDESGEAAAASMYAQRASSKKSSSGKRSSYGSTATAASTSTSAHRRGSERYNEVGEEVGDDSFASASSANSTGGSNGSPTQMDLVRNIAMLQELWSCDPSSPSASPNQDGSAGAAPTAWVRRAVILWTFETVYSVNERKMEVVKTPAGTGWRFLTTIDPASEYHQQQALVMPSGKNAHQQREQHHHQHHHHQQHQQHQQQVPSPPHSSTPQPYPMAYQTRRDGVMSPHPGYHQHLTAAMSEHLSSAWDPNASAGGYRQMSSPEAYQVPPPISLLDTTFGAGLATPPPTAGLPSPYGTTFDNSHHHQQTAAQHPHHQPQHRQHQHQHQHQHQQQVAVQPYSQHQQGYPSQLSFMPAPSAADAENSRVSVTAGQVPAGGGQHSQPVIDPFLAVAAAAADSGSVVGHGGGSELPDWDTQDMTSVLGSWPVTAGSSTAVGAGTVTSGGGAGSWQQQAPVVQQQQQQQSRGVKRGRSDSLDGTSGSGYPVASMPKLSHNGFSSWR